MGADGCHAVCREDPPQPASHTPLPKKFTKTVVPGFYLIDYRARRRSAIASDLLCVPHFPLTKDAKGKQSRKTGANRLLSSGNQADCWNLTADRLPAGLCGASDW
jgi:hypothetical protein